MYSYCPLTTPWPLLTLFSHTFPRDSNPRQLPAWDSMMVMVSLEYHIYYTAALVPLSIAKFKTIRYSLLYFTFRKDDYLWPPPSAVGVALYFSHCLGFWIMLLTLNEYCSERLCNQPCIGTAMQLIYNYVMEFKKGVTLHLRIADSVAEFAI